MKKLHSSIRTGISLMLLLLVACGDKEAKMAKGFALPKGNIEKGKQAFIDMKCHQCHTISGEKLPESPSPSQLQLRLGGEVRQIKTYGQLVTSIINPQHIVSEEYLEKLDLEKDEDAATTMFQVNDQMTVSQMIDIVEFLNSCYVKYESEYDCPYVGPYYMP